MDKTDKLINEYYDNYDNYVKIPDKISDIIENFKDTNKINLKLLVKNIIITILGLGTLTGGIVFAKEYYSKTFNLGKGIDRAIENGYIEIINQNKGDTNIYASEFLMDNTNISAKFNILFIQDLTDKIGINNIKHIELMDLVVIDENNIVLYAASENTLKEFCKNNNLDYTTIESKNPYLYGGLNSFLDNSSVDESICLTYNIYSGNLEYNYPKSKHLTYTFRNIKLIDDTENYKILNGDWKIDIDVPEVMYNRNTITYKVNSCSDQNLNLTTAKISETGFELGGIMHNLEIPEEIRKYREKMTRAAISIGEKLEYEKEYASSNLPITPLVVNYFPEIGETIEACTYIENEKGQKFKVSSKPGRKQKQQLINGDTELNFYETFELTKYDSTNKLKLHIVIYDKVIIVDLVKK